MLPDFIQQLGHFSFIEVNHVQRPAESQDIKQSTLHMALPVQEGLQHATESSATRQQCVIPGTSQNKKTQDI